MSKLILYRTTIQPAWIDYNGHLSEAYYGLVFGHATDSFLDHIGMNDTYRKARKCSVYTVETHMHYWQEIGQGRQVAIESQILGFHPKKILLHHTMMHEEKPIAAMELALLHVQKEPLKSTPFHPPVMAVIEKIWDDHQSLPPPNGRARVMAI